MKTTNKFLLTATAVAVMASSSAMAKTVYEDDNMYLNLTGEVAFEMVRSAKEDADMESKTDNVDLEVKAGYKLDNGVEVFGFYAFEFASLSAEADKIDTTSTDVTDVDGEDTTVTSEDEHDFLKDHYLAVKKGDLTVMYGDFDYAVDDFGITKELDANTAKGELLNSDDSDANGSKEVLLAKYKGDGFYVSTSYDIKTSDSDDETGYDIFAKFDVADGVSVGATYSVQDYFEDDGAMKGYGVQVAYTGVEGLFLGASYVSGDRKDASGIDVTAQYKVSDKVKVSVGASQFDYDDSDKDSITNMYVNANYNFIKNLDAYAEVYDEDIDGIGFVVGVSLDF